MIDQLAASCGSLSGTRRQTPEDARQEGQSAARNAVLLMVLAAGEELREEPIWPSAATTTYQPSPATGIRFALMLRDLADHEVSQHVRRARQEGLSWRQVGEILNPALWATDATADLGVMAFEYITGAASAAPFAILSFAWTCPSCGETVSDYGPYNGHPEDDQSGHADGCERLAADVAAYRARWHEED